MRWNRNFGYWSKKSIYCRRIVARKNSERERRAWKLNTKIERSNSWPTFRNNMKLRFVGSARFIARKWLRQRKVTCSKSKRWEHCVAPLILWLIWTFSLGNENSRSNDVGAGRETHSREASAIETTCEGALLYATPSNDHQTREGIGPDQEVRLDHSIVAPLTNRPWLFLECFREKKKN